MQTFRDIHGRKSSCIQYDSKQDVSSYYSCVQDSLTMTPDKEHGDQVITNGNTHTTGTKTDKMGQFTIQCEEGPSIVAYILTLGSLLLVLASMPLSLMFVVKVVQEYERAVIFRLGRLLTGEARGPGVFFVIPCLDAYQKIDMRTSTYDVPPQEVRLVPNLKLDPHQMMF